MDSFDQHIIEELRMNARQSVSAIATAVNLSRTAVSERIKKLEENGIIRGYQVLLSKSQSDGVAAYLEVEHDYSNCANAVDVFRRIPEVISCRGVSGTLDLLVYLQADSMQRLHEIRDHLDLVGGFRKVRTHIVMYEWINNQAEPASAGSD